MGFPYFSTASAALAIFFGSWANAQPVQITTHQSASNSTLDELDNDGRTFPFELATPIYGDIATEFYEDSSSQLSRSVSALPSSQRALAARSSTLRSRKNALRRLSSMLFLLTATIKLPAYTS
jgi:hypothetical protein